MKPLWKKLSDGTLKLSKIKLEVFLNWISKKSIKTQKQFGTIFLSFHCSTKWSCNVLLMDKTTKRLPLRQASKTLEFCMITCRNYTTIFTPVANLFERHQSNSRVWHCWFYHTGYTNTFALWRKHNQSNHRKHCYRVFHIILHPL